MITSSADTSRGDVYDELLEDAPNATASKWPAQGGESLCFRGTFCVC